MKENDLAIFQLIQTCSKVQINYFKITPAPEILFPASGKDGADLKLIESLKFLESVKS